MARKLYGLDQARMFSFEAASRAAHEFLEILRRVEIEPVKGGSLERMTYSLYDVLYRHEGDFIRPNEDVRVLFNDLSALAELALHIVDVQGHKDFPTLIPHLALLNEGEAAQTLRTSQLDQAANKIFELLAACLAMKCGTDVDLEAPDRGKGGNPDILATIRGRRWGIACKVLHSVHPESLIQNIVKGIDQIEKSEADTGFVFINVKNVIRRERYWEILNEAEWRNGGEPVFSAFWTPEEPERLLQEELDTIFETLQAYLEPGFLKSVFTDKKSQPGVFLYGHVMCGLTSPAGTAIPMAQRWPTWAGIAQPDEDASGVLQCFHHHLHDIPR